LHPADPLRRISAPERTHDLGVLLPSGAPKC
jgi:hypothetical protein